MELNEKLGGMIQALAAVPARSAPKAVVVALNSIIGDGADEATSYVSMDTTQSTTTWNCWVVTEHSIGHARIDYDRYLYDQHQESQEEVTPSAWSTWVRPLYDILGLRYGAFYAVEGTPTVFEPAEPITVIFGNEEIRIPERPVPVEQRAALGNFVTRLRDHVEF